MSDEPWYDPVGNPEQLHEDLRRNPLPLLAQAQQRPSLRRHIESCETCRQIREPGMPPDPRQRMVVALDHVRLRELLGLPPDIEILHVYALDEPNVVKILLSGAGPAAQ